MIDTITLLLPESSFRVLDYEVFNPSASGIYEPPYYKLSMGHISCVQNPTKKELEQGVYKPKLTLIKKIIRGGFSIMLKVEFSIPKLLLGNNFQEVEESDFDAIISKLHKILKNMSVDVAKEDLINSEVVCVHYSKNIVLTNTTSSLVINLLRKLDISRRLDTGDTDYRNEGQAIRFHTNSYELVFYDKIEDLKASKISDKRAIENDNSVQKDIFTKEELERLQVLRIELRLNNRKKMRDVFAKIGATPPPLTFYNLFRKDISRKFLLWFWSVCVEKSQDVLVFSEQSSQVIFSKLKTSGLKDGKILEAIGFLHIVKNEGIRTLKNLLKSKGNTYSRLQKTLEGIDLRQTYLCTLFESIRQTISNMESIKDVKQEAIQ